MDIRINNLESSVHLTDARAMLTPEVLEAIVRAVAERLRQEDTLRQDRERDVQIGQRSEEAA